MIVYKPAVLAHRLLCRHLAHVYVNISSSLIEFKRLTFGSVRPWPNSWTSLYFSLIQVLILNQLARTGA